MPRDVVAMLDGHRPVLRRRDLRIIERPKPGARTTSDAPMSRVWCSTTSGANTSALIGEYRARQRLDADLPRLPARPAGRR